MKYTVRIHKDGGIAEKKAEAGKNLLDFLRDSSFDVKSPCGGHGRCGKCRVRVSGVEKPPSEKEKSLLGSKAIDSGYRLACFNRIESDLEVYAGSTEEGARILTGGVERELKKRPIVTKTYMNLGTPGLTDQRSDLERVMSFSKKSRAVNSLDLLRSLPQAVRAGNYEATLCYLDDRLIAVEPGDTSGRLYGLAVDIGTTTIAAYLVDLKTGNKTDVYSMLNPQKKFGADVITRIDYTMRSQKALDEMNAEIVDCINHIAGELASRHNIDITDIYAAVFVGNTTMIHFLMKIPAGGIAVSPFIPATTRMHRFKAEELGIRINPCGYAIVFPSVSAYIGADIVAGVLSSGIYASGRMSLLIDIGTNGEIVLGSRKRLFACSTAAGPAFEGANIRNGVGGINGAIDRVRYDSDVRLSTIGGRRAVGICGSGIVDAIAGMLSLGIIDETGRIADASEMEGKLPESLAKRLVKIEDKNSFLLLGSEECDAETDIAITQKDVRELQNAKAAVAAGIRILARHAGVRLEDIERVYLAGGFGNYIDIDNALIIGLLPQELRGRIRSVGNVAGSGAVEGLISSKMLRKADSIGEKVEYLELSARKDFMDEYIECMVFE